MHSELSGRAGHVDRSDRHARRRRHRVAGVAAVAVLVALLTGCNPESSELSRYDPTWPGVAWFRYTGPSDAWLHVTASGYGDRRVAWRASVPAPGPNDPRECADRTTPATVSCIVIVPLGGQPAGDRVGSEFHELRPAPAGPYWPTVRVRPDEVVAVEIWCASAGEPAQCPAATRAVARATVERDGDPTDPELIGDLTVVTP